MDALLRDLRQGFRLLAAHRALSAVAVLSLALGIGANTAIFSVINAALLRMLPVKNPQELVILSDPNMNGTSIGIQTGVRSAFTFGEFEELRRANQVFSGVFASESGIARSSARFAGDAPEEVWTRLVSGDYFQVLGVTPVVGRTFTAGEDRAPGSAPYAVISYNFWRNRFGFDASVLGRSVGIGKAQLTIIGVLPPAFFGETVGEGPDLFIPMMMQPQVNPGRDWLHDDPSRVERVMWLHIVGRLKPGVPKQQAQANANLIFQRYLKAQAGTRLSGDRLRELLDQKIEARDGGRGASSVRDEAAEPLLVLMALVGLVLLIACANVANLLLARAASRRKEFGVRIALGAGRSAIIRQLLTESVMLSVVGGALGMLFAQWGTQALLRVLSSGNDSFALNADPDARVLGFTAALSVLTGLGFGLVPAFRLSGRRIQEDLRENARGITAGARRAATGKILVVAQIAISLLLLIAAGLFVRTLRNLDAVDLGYPREHLLIARIDSLRAGYEGPAAAALYPQLAERFRAIPGVRAVTFSENGLFGGTESGDRISVEGYRPRKRGDDAARFDQVGPNYFSGLGIPILAGRQIGPQDAANAPRVCVINETMARFYFGKENPIGRHVTDEFPDTRTTFEIVGVARDSRDHAIRGEVPRRFFIPALQGLGGIAPAMNFEIRTFADPGHLMNAVRREVAAVNPLLSIRHLATLDQLLDNVVRSERAIAQLSAFFGVLALVLACIGLYGVLSHAVARRTNEIGVRMALGAARSNVIRMVLRETAVMIAIGVAIGVPAAVAASRIVSSRLFGVHGADPATLAAASLVLSGIALLAGYLPARRASRIDPLAALRYE